MFAKKIIALLACTLAAVILLTFLYLTKRTPPNLMFLGFDRHFAEANTSAIDSILLPEANFYIAGTDKQTIYLGNHGRPMHLWLHSLTLGLQQKIILEAQPFEYRALMIRVNGDFVYLMDGSQPFIYRGRVGEWKLSPWLSRGHFMSAVPISGQHAVIMARKNGQATLGRISADMPAVWNDTLLKKQIDGFFCSYGQLHPTPDHQQLVYVFLYRNQFLVTDTHLNLTYAANTIDTISVAKIRVGRPDSTITSMASPPLAVNLQSAVADGSLYIISHIMAANEQADHFLANAVCDVYDLADGRYQYSFYVPKRNKKPFHDFRILSGQVLVGLYDQEMVTYRIPDNPTHR